MPLSRTKLSQLVPVIAVHRIAELSSTSPICKATSNPAATVVDDLDLRIVIVKALIDTRAAILGFSQQRFVVGSSHWSALQVEPPSMMQLPFRTPAAT
jgi:hypothetical protein